MNKFWVILADQNASVPTVHHITRQAAETEALRLATSRQKKFLVLELVSLAEPAERPAELHQTLIAEVPEEIPF